MSVTLNPYLNFDGNAREALEARLRSGALDEDTERDLRLALQVMDALWDEIQAQARLIHRDRRRLPEPVPRQGLPERVRRQTNLINVFASVLSL